MSIQDIANYFDDSIIYDENNNCVITNYGEKVAKLPLNEDIIKMLQIVCKESQINITKEALEIIVFKCGNLVNNLRTKPEILRKAIFSKTVKYLCGELIRNEVSLTYIDEDNEMQEMDIRYEEKGYEHVYNNEDLSEKNQSHVSLDRENAVIYESFLEGSEALCSAI